MGDFEGEGDREGDWVYRNGDGKRFLGFDNDDRMGYRCVEWER